MILNGYVQASTVYKICTYSNAIKHCLADCIMTVIEMFLKQVTIFEIRNCFVIQRNSFSSYTPCFLLLVVITRTTWPQPSLDTGHGCGMSRHPQLLKLPHNYLYLPLTPPPGTNDRNMPTDWDGWEMSYSQPCLPTPMSRSSTAAYSWLTAAHWPWESCHVSISDWRQASFPMVGRRQSSTSRLTDR